MRALSLLSLVLLLAAPDARRLEVSAQAGRVSIHAARVPLADVLEELVRKTGIEVVFESAPARALLVTADVNDLPEEEAIAKLFEAVPVSWGVTRRADGRRVERLVVADAQGTRRPSPSPSPRRSPIPPPQPPNAASYPIQPAPTPTPTPTPTPRPTPSPTPNAAGRPAPTPSPTAKPAKPQRRRPRPKATPTPKPSATPTPRAG